MKTDKILFAPTLAISLASLYRQRYQSRGSGYDKLIFYNYFLVATCGTLARYGTIGADLSHYARWSEAYPLTEEEIEKMCHRKPMVFNCS